MSVVIGLSIGVEVADCEHVLAATIANWVKMHGVGVTEAEKKQCMALLEDARKERDKDPQSPDQRLQAVRRRVADGLGSYRAAANLIANGAQGRDPQLERDLRAGGTFPNTDTKLKRLLAGLDVVMKEHASALAVRGFSKEDQARLVEDGKVYAKLLRTRGKDRGEAKKARLEREALFEKLRRMTSYLRRAGRTALRKSAARADFDRVVTRPAKAAKKAPEPVAAGEGAAAQVTAA